MKIYRKSNHHFRIPMVFLLCFCFIFCGFRFAPSDWMTSPTGSAKYLAGSTVLVSLFIEDPSSSWTTEKQDIVMSKMDLANDFLVSEGSSYGKTVNLIYDIHEHPDLAYTISYNERIDDSDDCSYNLLDYMTQYIDANIPSEDIMERYGVDSIAYMCFLDKSGVSYAFPYYEEDADQYYYETCFLFLRCDGDYEPPSVYAHELLHLFGARDLYATNEYDGITKDFVQHIETNYPNEIMLTTYDEHGNNVHEHVSNDLTDITAYFIGWKDTIPELDAHPSIRTEHPASFAEAPYNSGDYSDYTAGDSDNASDNGSHWGDDADNGSHWGDDADNGSHWGDDAGTSSNWGDKTDADNTNGITDGDWGSDSTVSGNNPNGFWYYIWRILEFFLE